MLDCRDIFEACGDRWGVGVALDALSTWVAHQDDALAERYARQSLDVRRSIGDQWGVAMSVNTLGWIAEKHGRLDEARQFYLESVAVRRHLDEDIVGMMNSLNGLGRVARGLGDYEEARRYHTENLELARAIGNNFRAAFVLGYLGFVDYDLGCYTEAKAHFVDCLSGILTLIGDQFVAHVKAALTDGTVDELHDLVDEAMSRFGNPYK